MQSKRTMEFGKNLKRLRKVKNISQQRIAKEIGVSQRTISHYEKGESEPSLLCLCKIAAFLGVSTDELLGHVLA